MPKEKENKKKFPVPTPYTSRFYFNSLIEGATFQLTGFPRRSAFTTTTIKLTRSSDLQWWYVQYICTYVYVYICGCARARKVRRKISHVIKQLHRIGGRVSEPRARVCMYTRTGEKRLCIALGTHIEYRPTTIISNGPRCYKSTYMRQRPPRWNRPLERSRSRAPGWQKIEIAPAVSSVSMRARFGSIRFPSAQERTRRWNPPDYVSTGTWLQCWWFHEGKEQEGENERGEERSDEEESKKEGGEQVDRWLDVCDAWGKQMGEIVRRDRGKGEKGDRSVISALDEREFGLVNKYAIRSRKTWNERIPVRKLL